MQCISSSWKVFISGFFMALAAVVGIIIFNIMMAVQTFQTIDVCVRKMGE
jgi:ABC-type transport system involved in cytochrome bd biosynthesis fused ATPase/permease subunit